MDTYVCGCRVGTADGCASELHGTLREGDTLPPTPKPPYALPASFSGWAYLRDPVRRFSLAIEAKLRIHDAGRGATGWRDMNVATLLWRLRDEVRELAVACEAPLSSVAGRARIGGEAVDVANFAMMIADVAGALTVAPSGVPDADDMPGDAVGDRTFLRGSGGRVAIYHSNLDRWHIYGPTTGWTFGDHPTWSVAEVHTVGSLGEHALDLANQQIYGLEVHLASVEGALRALRATLDTPSVRLVDLATEDRVRIDRVRSMEGDLQALRTALDLPSVVVIDLAEEDRARVNRVRADRVQAANPAPARTGLRGVLRRMVNRLRSA